MNELPVIISLESNREGELPLVSCHQHRAVIDRLVAALLSQWVRLSHDTSFADTMRKSLLFFRERGILWKSYRCNFSWL